MAKNNPTSQPFSLTDDINQTLGINQEQKPLSLTQDIDSFLNTEKADQSSWDVFKTSAKASYQDILGGINYGLSDMYMKFGELTGDPFSTLTGLDALSNTKERENKSQQIRSNLTQEQLGSWSSMLGSASVSIIPSAVGIGLSAMGLPEIGAPLAQVGFAGLTASTYGNSLKEYDDYKKQKGEEIDPLERYSVALANAGIEYASERLGVSNRWLNSLNRAGKPMVKAGVIESIDTGKDMIKKFIQSNPEKAKSLMKMISLAGIEEGSSEALAEFSQGAVTNWYKDVEDREDFKSLLDNAWKAGVIGMGMGVGLGPLSYKAQSVSDRKRREDQGLVRLGQLGEDSVEILGRKDGKDGETAKLTVMYPDGYTKDVDESSISETVDLTPGQFYNVLKGKTDENVAIEQSRIDTDKQKRDQINQKFDQDWAQFSSEDESGNKVVTTAKYNQLPVFIVGQADTPNTVFIVDKQSGSTPKMVHMNSLVEVESTPLEVIRQDILGPLNNIPEDASNPPQIGEPIEFPGIGEGRIVSYDPNTGEANIEFGDPDADNSNVQTITRNEIEQYRTPPQAKAPEVVSEEAQQITTKYAEDGSPIEDVTTQNQESIQEPPVTFELENSNQIQAVRNDTGVLESTQPLRKKEAEKLIKELEDEYPNNTYELVNRTIPGPTSKADFRIAIKQNEDGIQESKISDQKGLDNEDGGSDLSGDRIIEKGRGNNQQSGTESSQQKSKPQINETTTENRPDTQGQATKENIGGDRPAGQEVRTGDDGSTQGTQEQSKLEFKTHTGEKVTGKKLQKALDKVADDWAENARKVRESDEYADHVTEAKKDEILQKDIETSEKIRRGEGLDNFTFWQRVNEELTGESVAFLPDSTQSGIKQPDSGKTIPERVENNQEIAQNQDAVTKKSGNETGKVGQNTDMVQQGESSVPTDTKQTDSNQPSTGTKKDQRAKLDDKGKSRAKKPNRKVRPYNKLTKKEQATVDKLVDDYIEERNTRTDLSTKDKAIMESGPLTTTNESFRRFNDKNNITTTLAKTYLRKKGTSLDVIAQNVNDIHFNGEEVVSPEDVADFMIKNPSGPDQIGTPAREIADQYKEITGKNLSIRSAKSIAKKSGVSEKKVKELASNQDFLDFANLTFKEDGKINWDALLNELENNPGYFTVFPGGFTGEDLVNLQAYAEQEKDKQSSGAKESGNSGQSTKDNEETDGGGEGYVPFQRSNPNQVGLFGSEAPRTAPTRRDVLNEQLKNATKRLRDLNKLPQQAKSNLVMEEMAALKKDINRLFSQLNETMSRDQATKGGQQQTLFQRTDAINQSIQEAIKYLPQLKGTDETNAVSTFLKPFVAQNKAKIEKAIDQVLKKYKQIKRDEVKVWESVLDFQFAYPDLDIPSNMSGVYYDGKLHVIAGHPKFTQGRVLDTILHEGVAHYGLRRMFGIKYSQEEVNNMTNEEKEQFKKRESEFNNLLDTIYDKYSDDERFLDIAKNYEDVAYRRFILSKVPQGIETYQDYQKWIRENQSDLDKQFLESLSTSQNRMIAEELIAHEVENDVDEFRDKTILERIVEFLRKAWNDLTGSNLDLSTDEIRQIISASKKFLRTGNVYIPKFELTPVEGMQDVQLADDLRFQIAPPVDSDAFKAWFGDSVLTDNYGNPKVLYHGRPQEITQFDESYGGETTANNEYGAFYFSDVKEVGEDYSRQSIIRRYQDYPEGLVDAGIISQEQYNQLEDDGVDWYSYVDELAEDRISVVEAYGRMENPLIVDAKHQNLRELEERFNIQAAIGYIKGKDSFDESIMDYIEEEYDQDDIENYRDEIEERARENYSLEEDEEIEDWQFEDATREILEENDIYPEVKEFDGIIIKNVIDDIGDQSSVYQDVHIFIDPNQIKSIHNTGGFSRSNNDIRFQLSPPVDSPAFKNWFGDSKVVDENGMWTIEITKPIAYMPEERYIQQVPRFNEGDRVYVNRGSAGGLSISSKNVKILDKGVNPKVVYHGTGGNFDAFKSFFRIPGQEGYFFIDNPSEASKFAGSARITNYPSVYPVYLSLQNPLEVDFEGGMYQDEKMREYFKQANDNGNDGIIIKNIKDRSVNATQYVAFSPTQIKSATGNNGNYDPYNPDIRFQLSKPIEESGELIAMHNLSPKSLKNIAKIGGLPMPSLAITKSAIPFESFGNISLIADKSMIDPKDKTNRVFAADAYSPRYPKVDYFPKLAKVKEMFEQYVEDVPVGISSRPDDIQNSLMNDGFDYAKQEELVQIAYLKEKGKRIPKINKLPKPEVAQYVVDYYQNKIKEDDQWVYHAYKFDPEFQKLVRQSFKEKYKPSMFERLYGDDKELPPHSMSQVMRDIEKVTNGKDEYDTVTFKSDLRKLTANKDYDKWFDSKIEELDIDEKLFGGFTPSGTRRYLPHTVENVIKLMRRENVIGGEAWNYGVGSLRSKLTPQFRNIAQIKAASDKLVESEEFQKIKEEITSEYQDLVEEWRSNDPMKSGNIFDDRMGYMLQEAAVIGLPRAIREYNLDLELIDRDLIDKTKAFFDKLVGFPSEYFEAKPNRAVPLSDFKLALIPKGTDADIRKILTDNGIKTVVYDNTVKGDRQLKLNQALDKKANRDIRFQRTPEFTKDYNPTDNFYSNSLKAVSNINQGKATADQWRSMLLKNGASESELKWIGFDDFLRDNPKPTKDQVYDFIQSNQVEVKEVVKGNDKMDVTVNDIVSVEEVDDDWYVEFSNGAEIQIRKFEAETEDEARELAVEEYNDNPDNSITNEETKYSQYTLPGGQHYKELLLTMPKVPTQFMYDINPKTGNYEKRPTSTRQQDLQSEYGSSHWSEKNILAHIRFNEREVNGERTLFVEEIQSDFAQDIRKKGVKTMWKPEQLRVLSKSEVLNEYGQDSVDRFYVIEALNEEGQQEQVFNILRTKFETEKEAVDYIVKEKVRSGELPDMPFKQTTQWLNLSIRRMIRYASENGFERIAFVNGQQSADRYDLSKQIDGLKVNQYENGDYGIHTLNKDGSLKDNIGIHKRDNLPDVVGKEMANKIVSDLEQVEPTERGNRRKEYYGLDLKVGGTGMINFYDKIVPSVSSKLLKKLDKTAKLETVEIETEKQIKSGDIIAFNDLPEKAKEAFERYDNEEITVKEFADEMSELGYEVDYDMDGSINTITEKIPSQKTQQLSFPITPRIRQTALQEGLPLFQRVDTLQEPSNQFAKKHDKFISTWQDRHIYLKRLQELKYSDKQIADELNVYDKENLSKGIIMEQIRVFKEKLWSPLDQTLNEISREGITLNEASRYLKAKHIVEDNIEKGGIPQEDYTDKDGNPQKGAKTLVQEFEAKTKKSGLDKKLREHIVKINQYILDKRLESGLISKEAHDKLSTQYKFYVPLRGFNEAEIDPTIFTKEFARKGRESESADPMAYLGAMAQTAIQKGEQNKVLQSLYRFVVENPDSKIYQIKTAFYLKDKETGKLVDVVHNRPTKQQFEDYDVSMTDPSIDDEAAYDLYRQKTAFERENITVKIKGKTITIQFIGNDGQQVAQALKGQSLEKFPKLLGVIRNYTGLLRQLYTQYSPEFAIRNFIRDTFTGLINVRTDWGTKTGLEVAGNIPGAVNTVRKWVFSGKYDTNSEDGRYLQEYVENGAKTGYSDLKTVSDIQKELRQSIKAAEGELSAFDKAKGMTKESVMKILKPIDDVNRMFENATRFAAFKTLRKKGVSPQQAAIYAKDLTVNFNRKGNLSDFIGNFYLFFNASVQGVERLARPFLSGTKQQKVRAYSQAIFLLPAIHMMLLMVNRMWWDEDEDGEYYYDKLPEYIRTHNLTIPNFFSDKPGSFFHIPLPYGFNVLFTWPEQWLGAIEGRVKPADAILRGVSSATESFSPLGSPNIEGLTNWESMLQYFAPTVAKPAIDVTINRNFMGKQIYKEPYPGQTPDPDSQRYFQSVNPMIRSITDTMNAWTGGDEIVPGFVDVNPEVIEHFMSSYTGGVGKFITNVAATGMNLAEGKNPLSYEKSRVRNTPFARNYTSSIDDYYYQEKFYELSQEVEAKKDLYDRYIKSRNREAAKNYLDLNKNFIRLSSTTDDYMKRLQEMRNRKNALKALGRDKEAEVMEERMTELFKKYIKMYDSQMGKERLDWREILGFK